MQCYIVDNDDRLRLDMFLAGKIDNLSRSSVQKLIENGSVKVNGNTEKTKYKLSINDKIIVDYDEQSANIIPKIILDIIYQDDDCIVLNKPAGILTHSKGAFNPEATVATFIEDMLIDLTGERAGIVHRLDRATSGVIICAKNQNAMSWLQKQFSQRRVKKTYYAVIDGHLNPKQAIIDMPIERHPRNPKTFRTGLNGKPATTEYQVIKSGPFYDLVKLSPKTGRTHQLRVHLKQQHHPIVGDTLYDGPSADRLYLHAETLELTLPNRQRKVFNVEMPKEFNELVTEND